MATDPKLTSSILDLSRNVDKLTAEVKKNTSAVQTLSENKEQSPEVSDKLGEVADGIKNINFEGVSDQLSNFSKDLKQLDFKSLGKKLEELDFKSLSSSLKSFDLNKFGEKILGGAGGEKIGDRVKSVVSGTFKDLKKGILGGFEAGGSVNKTGNYVVGERGPEIVKLKSGDKVVSNKNAITDQLLKMALEDRIQEKTNTKKSPTPAEIEAKKRELLAEDPDLANNPEALAEEIKYFISEFGRGTFTKESLAKLSVPVKPKEIVPPSESKEEISRKEARERRRKLKETPLFKAEGKESAGEEGAEKTGGLKSITQNLGKEISGIFKKIGGENETLVPPEGINKTTGLGLAAKKSPLPTAGGLLQPTLKTSLSKISVAPKITKEAGELVKSNLGIKKAGAGIESFLDNFTSKIGDLFTSKKKSEKEEVTDQSTASTVGSEEEKLPGSSQAITKNDLDEMKAVLGRIASLLEGPISVAPLDYPFRPDSRRV